MNQQAQDLITRARFVATRWTQGHIGGADAIQHFGAELMFQLAHEIERSSVENGRLKAALEDIGSEACSYVGCRAREFDQDRTIYDPECPGEVCTARAALRRSEIPHRETEIVVDSGGRL